MFFWHQNEYNHIKLHVVIALSAVAAMASLANFFFWGSVSEAQIMNTLVKMEALKAGGQENREKVQTLYNSETFKQQQAQAIDQALQRLWAEQPAQPSTTTETTTQTSGETLTTLSQDQLKAIKANAYIDGDKNAKIIVLEYTDPECPFCVRHFKDNTIKTVMDGNKDIAHIVKVVQGVNHTNTEYKSTAVLCAGKLKGEKAYYTMFNNIMGNTQWTFPQFTLVTNEQVDGYAKDLGINKQALDECRNSADIKSQYAAYRQEAIGLNASGTPGNIVINTENGNYIALAGAYPASAFTDAITKLQ